MDTNETGREGDMQKSRPEVASPFSPGAAKAMSGGQTENPPANGATGIREVVAFARSFGGGQMESDPAGVSPVNKGEHRVRRDRFTTVEGRSIAVLVSDLINELESKRHMGSDPEAQRALSEAQTALQKAADALWHVYH